MGRRYTLSWWQTIHYRGCVNRKCLRVIIFFIEQPTQSPSGHLPTTTCLHTRGPPCWAWQCECSGVLYMKMILERRHYHSGLNWLFFSYSEHSHLLGIPPSYYRLNFVPLRSHLLRRCRCRPMPNEQVRASRSSLIYLVWLKECGGGSLKQKVRRN
jgi:hypothetical protein